MELTELNISGSIAQKNSFIITEIKKKQKQKTESERRCHYYSLLSSLGEKRFILSRG